MLPNLVAALQLERLLRMDVKRGPCFGL